MPNGYLPRITAYNARQIIESVISPTQLTLDPEVWRKIPATEANEDGYELDGSAQGFLTGVAAQLGRFGTLKGIYLVGSMTSFQWEPDSDLDLTIVIDPRSEEAYGEAIACAAHTTGMDTLPGTQHTANPFVETELDSDLDVQDGLYDVLENKWVRGPYSIHADVAKYMHEFRRLVRAIDIVAGELKRDLMDYHTLESLPPEALSGLADQTEKIVKRLDRESEILDKVYGKVHDDRERVFSHDVTPEELKEWHNRQLMPGNVIYKLLERYHYLTLLKAVHHAMGVSGGHVEADDELEIALGVETEALLTEEPPPNDWQVEQTWFHGTPGTKRAKSIAKFGIRPGRVSRYAYTSVSPRKGFVYITTKWTTAESFASDKELLSAEDPYGYIFEIPGSALKNVEPDEDDVHSMLSWRDYPDWLDKLMRSLGHDPDKTPPDWLDPKELLNHMTDEQKAKLMNWKEPEGRLAHKGMIRPIKVWRKKIIRKDREISGWEEIPMSSLTESFLLPTHHTAMHFYHGTTKARAEQIKQAHAILPVPFKGDHYVWLSTDWYEAYDHAASRADVRGEAQDIVVFRVDIPPGPERKKIHRTMTPAVYVFNGQIPVEWAKVEMARTESRGEGSEGLKVLVGGLRKKLWKTANGLKVYIVDGSKVREKYNLDFDQGGNECAYDWVPAGEIWIDDNTDVGERKYILGHEMYERNLMLHGMDYEEAHKLATEYEKKLRTKDGHKVTAESVQHGFGVLPTEELNWLVEEFYKELKNKVFEAAQEATPKDHRGGCTVFPASAHQRYPAKSLPYRLPYLFAHIHWEFTEREVRKGFPIEELWAEYMPARNEISTSIAVVLEKGKPIDRGLLEYQFMHSRIRDMLFEELDHWNTVGPTDPQRSDSGFPDLEPYEDRVAAGAKPGALAFKRERGLHYAPWQEWVTILDLAHSMKQNGWKEDEGIKELVKKKYLTKEIAKAAWDEAEQYQVESLKYKALDEVYFVWTPESGLLTMKDGDRLWTLTGNHVTATTVADHIPIILTWVLQRYGHKLGDMLEPDEARRMLQYVTDIEDLALRGCFYTSYPGNKDAGIEFYDTWGEWDEDAQHDVWLATEAIWRKYPKMQNARPMNMSSVPLEFNEQESLREDEYADRTFDKIPHALLGLAAEAKKCSSFKEFESDFLGQIKHGKYWHVTEDPNFKIDPAKGPRDMSSMAVGHKVDVGKLMVTSHLDYWAGEYAESRKYAAEIDMSEVPREAYKQVSRGFDNEFFVTDPSKAKVVRVLPLRKAIVHDHYVHELLPENSRELLALYQKATGKQESLREDEYYANRKGQNFWGDKGAGVLPIAKSTGRLLLSMRSSEVNEPNTWGVWGGRTDEEDPRDGALREFREECGYGGSVRLIPSTIFRAKGFSYHNYIGIVEEEFKPVMGWEVESFEWMTLDEVLKAEPKHFGLKHLLSKAEGQIRKVVQQLKPSTRESVEQAIDEKLGGDIPPVVQKTLFTRKVEIPPEYTPESIAEKMVKSVNNDYMESCMERAREELGDEAEESEVEKYAEEMYKDDVRGFAEDALDNLSDLSDPMNLYRMIMTKPSSPSHVNKAKTGIMTDHLGVCWAWDIDGAEAHWGHFSTGNREITLYAQVEAKYVDWELTLRQNSDPASREEKEIRLKENTPICVTRIKVQNGPWRRVNLVGKA